MDLLDTRLYKRVKFSRILFNLITLQGLIMKLYGAQIMYLLTTNRILLESHWIRE